MKNVSVPEFIQSVKIIMDENGVSNSVLSTNSDQLQIDAIIKSKIIESIKHVHLSARAELLDLDNDFSGADTVTNQDGTGYIKLPSDFLRLVIFKLSNWRSSVINAISDADPLYIQQKSRFLGIRGNSDKPVCAITRNKTGRILEFYSAEPNTTAEIDLAYCLKEPVISINSVNICDKLIESVYYHCAALTCISIGETEKSKSLIELSKLNYERA